VVSGFFLLTLPGTTLLFLPRVLGLFLLAGDMLRIASILTNSFSWGWKLTASIIGVLASILVLGHPLLGAILAPVVVFVVGVLALIQRILGLVLGFRGGGWSVDTLGIFSVLFGLTVLLHPLIGTVLLPFLLRIFMLIGGVTAIVGHPVCVRDLLQLGLDFRDLRRDNLSPTDASSLVSRFGAGIEVIRLVAKILCTCSSFL